jgi:hypothetical protein
MLSKGKKTGMGSPSSFPLQTLACFHIPVSFPGVLSREMYG